jgi:hypothetical protein
LRGGSIAWKRKSELALAFFVQGGRLDDLIETHPFRAKEQRAD